jgi:four helix bundle protein
VDRPNYEKLEVWKDGIELVKDIYKITLQFPKDEAYGLTSQLRRAAVSVPANIAEGHGRGTKKDFRQFLYITKGSLQELSTLIHVARLLNYLEESAYQKIQIQILSLVRRVSSLIKNLVPPS